MKIFTVVGARPQFIKAAVVSRLLRAQPNVREILVHTGQHFDEAMSEVFFQELDLPLPDCNLGVSGGSHGDQTGHALPAMYHDRLIGTLPSAATVYSFYATKTLTTGEGGIS